MKDWIAHGPLLLKSPIKPRCCAECSLLPAIRSLRNDAQRRPPFLPLLTLLARSERPRRPRGLFLTLIPRGVRQRVYLGKREATYLGGRLPTYHGTRLPTLYMPPTIPPWVYHPVYTLPLCRTGCQRCTGRGVRKRPWALTREKDMGGRPLSCQKC